MTEMKPTPFMTAESWYIDGEVVFMEIPIDWGKITGGNNDERNKKKT